MSADAKAWIQNGDPGWLWRGRHDGPCKLHGDLHTQGGTLGDVVRDLEFCLGRPLRWEIRSYPDGALGLVAYLA